MKKIFLPLLLLVTLVMTGCVSRLGAFTVISTKNIDWSRSAQFVRSSQRVEGEDSYHIIIFIPTKMNITIEDAVNSALNQIPGGIALVDAVLRHKFFYIPYIYGNEAFIVEGNVLVDPYLADGVDIDESSYYQGYYGNDKKFHLSKLDETEYNEIRELTDKK